VRYNPGDLVKIGMCNDRAYASAWIWRDKVGIIVRYLDPLAMVVADAGTGGYEYQLLLNGELLYFHEDELERLPRG